mmetsp:Transcript_9053/g.21622  ORF Transcript_9053/g.21622 Transcript_9053/m.21622 type:complete len:205 (-) Transcript_9053:34-648(-)
MQSKKIWIGGLPSDTTDGEVERLCEKYGKVIDVHIRTSPRDRFAFVQFEDDAQADDAIRALDQTKFNHCTIKVSTANPAGPRGPDRRPMRGDRDRRNGSRPRRRSPSRRRNSRTRSIRRSRSGSRRKVFRLKVEGMPDDMDGPELKEIASNFGSVSFVSTFRERGVNCATIELGTEDDARHVQKELDNRRISGTGGCRLSCFRQ